MHCFCWKSLAATIESHFGKSFDFQASESELKIQVCFPQLAAVSLEHWIACLRGATLTPHDSLFLLLADILVHIVGPTRATLLYLVHGVTHNVQILCAFLHLPLHVGPVSFLLALRTRRGGTCGGRSFHSSHLLFLCSTLLDHTFRRWTIRATNYCCQKTQICEKSIDVLDLLKGSISAGVT